MAKPPPEVLAWANSLQAGNDALQNMETQGFNNLWFSRAGQYDRAHKGTYGGARTRELLAALNETPFGFKPQISAGYANVGHSNGKGGEHVAEGVFDIGLSGRTSKDAQKIKQVLDTQGVSYLEEGKGTSNWHLHVRGGKQKLQQARSANAARTKELTLPVPEAAPRRAELPKPETISSKQPPLEVLEWAKSIQSTPVQPKTNFMGDFYNHGIANLGYQNDQAIRQSGHGWGAGIGDVVNGLLTVGGGTLAGAGAGSVIPGLGTATGGVAGGITTAAGAGVAQDLQAQRLAGAKQMDIGRALSSGAIQGGLQAIPVVGQARPLLQRIAANAAIQGAGGAAGSVAQQGLEQHTITPNVDWNRVRDMGVLGSAGGAVGGLSGKGTAAKVAKPAELPTPQPAIKTQADIIRNLADIERQTKANEILNVLKQPEQIVKEATGTPYYGFTRNGTPQEAPQTILGDINTPEQVKTLAQDFQARSTREIIDPRNAPIPESLGPLKTDTTDSGVIVATKAGERQTPQVEIERGLPDGERVYPTKEMQTQSIVDPSTGQPFRPMERPLRPARDIALERAEAITKRADDADIHKPGLPRPDKSVALPSTPRGDMAPAILDAQGQPMRGSGVVRELEIPNKPKPTEAPLELPASVTSPKVRELPTRPEVSPPASEAGTIQGNVHTRPSGAEVYTQGREAANVEQIAQALENQSQIVALEEAKRLLSQKKAAGMLSPEDFQKQTDILNLFEEAGRTGKTFNAMRREIQEGEGTISRELGKAEVKAREDLSPFAVTVRARKPSTEVGNMVRRLGSAEAARDALRQMAGKYGITPTTAGKTPKANATKIAEQIAAHPKGKLEFTDIYLNAHNFKTGGIKTATDAPRGYPLRTFESANIGTEAASIPQGAMNQNAIGAQFQALEQLKQSPDIAPELKQVVTKVTDNPNVGFKDIRKMRESVAKHLEQFCNIWGMK